MGQKLSLSSYIVLCSNILSIVLKSKQGFALKGKILKKESLIGSEFELQSFVCIRCFSVSLYGPIICILSW